MDLDLGKWGGPIAAHTIPSYTISIPQERTLFAYADFGQHFAFIFGCCCSSTKNSKKEKEKQAERKMLQQKGSPDRSDMKYGI